MGMTSPSSGAPLSDPAGQSVVLGAVQEEIAHTGFVLSSVDKLVSWARTGSMWPMTLGWPAAPSK